MENIKWKDIDNKIQNLDYPLSFLYYLFKSKNKIDDINLSLLTRYFLKHHFNIAIKYNLIKLSSILDKKHSITKKTIIDFYKLLIEKYEIGKKLILWKDAYPKKDFWDKNILEQINKLDNLKMIFYSNFDICKSNVLFHNKIYNILLFNKDDEFNLNHLINRLRNIYLLFENDFFIKYNIILVKKNRFIEIDLNDKIKYCTYLFQKINKIILETTSLFEIFNYLNIQLNNLMNPYPIYLTKGIINSNIDINDILFMIKN